MGSPGRRSAEPSGSAEVGDRCPSLHAWFPGTTASRSRIAQRWGNCPREKGDRPAGGERSVLDFVGLGELLRARLFVCRCPPGLGAGRLPPDNFRTGPVLQRGSLRTPTRTPTPSFPAKMDWVAFASLPAPSPSRGALAPLPPAPQSYQLAGPPGLCARGNPLGLPVLGHGGCFGKSGEMRVTTSSGYSVFLPKIVWFSQALALGLGDTHGFPSSQARYWGGWHQVWLLRG